ncbi:LPXTG-motif cell wall-anchored protein [Hamadaea flava]|uniref:LPXTG cell wall anchor domain-containing protein n=1 Tax=Hamadaea flava TaxID=1742688 RepID=A0ABV8LJZ9_9ACTN|nr:LPXTG cell wall anchor domain-containing protein [Hamadaea flava]MCP2323760.1 LPXTG-motif cell wall-anchored protein [Hamadaea flava]
MISLVARPVAINPLSTGGYPVLGLVLLAIGGWLLWRSRRAGNPSRREERLGGIAFAVLGFVIAIGGLIAVSVD